MKYHCMANVIPDWEKSLSETEKWILANLFDWFVNQIIQRRKLLTRCTSIKIPPWPSCPPPSAPPWTASAPPPSPAPSAQRESSIKYQYLDHHHLLGEYKPYISMSNISIASFRLERLSISIHIYITTIKLFGHHHHQVLHNSLAKVFFSHFVITFGSKLRVSLFLAV